MDTSPVWGTDVQVDDDDWQESCWESCSHGGSCSLEADHNGPHQSMGTRGQVFCTWHR